MIIKILSQIEDKEIRETLEEVQDSKTIGEMIGKGFKLGRLLGAKVVEEILNERGKAKRESGNCERCGTKLESKGQRGRSLVTILGKLCWSRQMRRCPKGCKGSQIAPIDKELGIESNQRTGPHIKRMGCALAVFVPFEIAASLLLMITGVSISSSSIWNWVQESGKRAKDNLEAKLKAVDDGQKAAIASMTEQVKRMAMLIGADGVMVPFRRHEKSPKGKTQWCEVKVGIVARWQKKTESGKNAARLVQKRVTACRGTIDDFKPRLWLLACEQGLEQASMVVWLSDGARGFWRIFRELFEPYAIGILDFFHAAQNIWKGITPWLDGRTTAARDWFQQARTTLKHQHSSHICLQLQDTLDQPDLPDSARHSLDTLHSYLHKHANHTHYAHYQRLGIPIGSGFVESACKWLIQQRFKCVGMRWSYDGFDHLLHLRLAWVNGSFDDLFYTTPI